MCVLFETHEVKAKMENEMTQFFKVWFSVLVSLTYSYAIAKTIPKGLPRLLFLLPIICLFFYLPLNLFSVHLGGFTAFIIAWLTNFKLLLFAFDKGPLSSHVATTSLPTFVSLACLPIKVQQNPYPKSQNSHNPSHKIGSQPQRSNLSNYLVKFLLGFVLILAYNFTDFIHPKIILVFYCIHIYLFLEIALAILAHLARTTLGFELEPQFNEPYLSTSLQDFWGRRWNLMVSGILRPTVYNPTLHITRLVCGRNLAVFPAILATFFVSGAMHELMFYYLLRLKPTWEVSWFFILHGFYLTAEILVKKALKDRFRLPRVISVILTLGFVMVTGDWLFFPQFLRGRADVRAFEEYAALGAFLRKIVSSWPDYSTRLFH